MNKIIYVNQKQLADSRLSNLLLDYPQHNWDNFSKMRVELYKGHDAAYNRAGVDLLPLINTPIDSLNLTMPDYDPLFNLTFDEITDLRLTQLIRQRNDKRWLLLWSGGIDSMVIITSILKNLSKDALSNIDIACNRISIYEHPKFFYKYIEPNFTLLDSSNLKLTDRLLQKYYIIDGEPADQLFGGIASRSFTETSVLKNWRTDPDEMLDFMAKKVDRPFAEWFYQTTSENIVSTDVPVETYYDFFWWTFFNYSWASIKLRPLQYQTSMSITSAQLYFDNFIHWFNTVEYQKWSLVNRVGVKYGANIGERKLASKKYIYDFDHDEYYFKFKVKMESVSREVPGQKSKYFCMLDDYTRLTLDKDLDQILELFPAHINT